MQRRSRIPYYAVTLSSNQDFIGYLIQARVPLAGETFDRFRIVGTMISAGPQGTILYCNSTSDSPNAPPLPVSSCLISIKTML